MVNDLGREGAAGQRWFGSVMKPPGRMAFTGGGKKGAEKKGHAE